MGDFPLYFKSTIDYLVNALAAANGYAYYDADAVGMWASVQESEGPALAWSLAHFAPDPCDPTYEAIIEIGPQTSLDPAQYSSLKAISLVGEAFQVGGFFFIRDYSGTTTPTVNLGSGGVIEAQTEPSIADKTSSLRMWRLRVKLVRFP